jgi:hypothetical protein
MQKIQFSQELNLIISLINVALNKKSSESISIPENINWDRFNSLADFHSVRLILYHAVKKINSEKIPISVTERLRIFSLKQTFNSLEMKHEASHLIALIRKSGLRMILYKGLFFVEEIYKSRNFREMGDIDFIAHNDDFSEIFQLIIENGYELYGNNNQRIDISHFELEDLRYNRVLELRKSTSLMTIQIDLHSNIYANYSQINVPSEIFFLNESDKLQNCLIMMLVHHGNREGWVKLKYLVDWILLLDTLPVGFDFDTFYKEITSYKLTKAFNTGNKLVDFFFDREYLPGTSQKPLADIDSITTFWNAPNELHSNLTFTTKMKIERLIWSIQDNPSFFKYLSAYYEIYSMPNLLEKTPRVITFPVKFKFFNFLSKMITVLLKGH